MSECRKEWGACISKDSQLWLNRNETSTGCAYRVVLRLVRLTGIRPIHFGQTYWGRTYSLWSDLLGSDLFTLVRLTGVRPIHFGQTYWGQTYSLWSDLLGLDIFTLVRLTGVRPIHFGQTYWGQTYSPWSDLLGLDMGVSNRWNGIWNRMVEWKMEWNGECT